MLINLNELKDIENLTLRLTDEINLILSVSDDKQTLNITTNKKNITSSNETQTKTLQDVLDEIRKECGDTYEGKHKILHPSNVEINNFAKKIKDDYLAICEKAETELALYPTYTEQIRQKDNENIATSKSSKSKHNIIVKKK